MLRTIIAAACTAIAIAILTGCSNTPDNSTTTSAAAPTTLRRGEINDSDRAFLADLSDTYWTNSVDRADLIQGAETACTRMRNGDKVQVIADLSEGKVDGNSVTASPALLNHAATFLHAAAVAYCPDQLTGVH